MNVIIDNKELPLEIMSTPNATSTGMMGRENLDGGMLFIFDDVSERSFWMKNCLIPLDIIFIVNNKITKIYKDCPPCNDDKCENYYGVGNRVLELPAGEYSLVEGDVLSFTE
tara:strand:- start:62 stop:397 length:336 start_codon:yes stop_codon:yes gene_type:complete